VGFARVPRKEKENGPAASSKSEQPKAPKQSLLKKIIMRFLKEKSPHPSQSSVSPYSSFRSCCSLPCPVTAQRPTQSPHRAGQSRAEPRFFRVRNNPKPPVHSGGASDEDGPEEPQRFKNFFANLPIQKPQTRPSFFSAHSWQPGGSIAAHSHLVRPAKPEKRGPCRTSTLKMDR